MRENDAQKRMQAAYKLVSNSEFFSLENLEAAKTLVAGINPKVDRAFDICVKALTKVEKVRQKDILQLSVEALPEKTEVQKKRKKAIVFFLTEFENLKSEMQRVQTELKEFKQKTEIEKAASGTRIFLGAKGPFGIGTLIALIIVGAMFLVAKPQSQSVDQSVVKTDVSPTLNPKEQGILAQDKILPLIEVVMTTGDECDREMHYHAKDHIQAIATDGSIVYDPGGCGFGKVKDVKVVNLK